MLNYGIIGFGGLGKSHFFGYEKIRNRVDVCLKALCDVRKEMFETSTETNISDKQKDLDLKDYNIYYDAEEMLEKEKLDFVLVVVPTYLHEEISVMAMKKGVHVFCEKPMSLTVEACSNMIETAKQNNVRLMIGHCLRFGAPYVKAKQIIDSKEYGEVVRADFYRLSGQPVWGFENWFMDSDKSGGAALDLHIHDADYILYSLGKPKSVRSQATHCAAKFDSIVTSYEYDDKVVTATGEWGSPRGYRFSAGFFIKMEKATLELKAGELTLYKEGENVEKINIDGDSGYVNEVVEFAESIINNKESEINPASASLEAVSLVLKEKESALTGEKVLL